MTSNVKPLPRIGVDRLVFAQKLTDTETGATYATSLAMIAAVELTETPNAEIANFHADDGIYVQTSRSGEPTVAATLANIDPETWALLMGATYSSANGLVEEGLNNVPLEGAFGYRAQLSNGTYEYIWYMMGVFSKSAKTYNTKAESVAYQTTPIQFNAKPIVEGAIVARRFTTDDPNAPVGLTDDALKSITTGWFSDPNIVPVAPGTPIADFAVTTGSAGELDATWTMPVSATSQKIQVLDPVSGEYQDATLSATLLPTGSSATITGLTATNTYTARLVVVSGTNNGISNTDSAAAG